MSNPVTINSLYFTGIEVCSNIQAITYVFEASHNFAEYFTPDKKISIILK